MWSFPRQLQSTWRVSFVVVGSGHTSLIEANDVGVDPTWPLPEQRNKSAETRPP
jgi:hypothetical protein